MADNRLTITMDCWDKYKDVRAVFFESLKREWGNNPYPIVIACNSLLEDENIAGDVILCDDSLTDSKRHLCALKSVNTEYVLLIVEDGLFTSKVNTSRIEEILDYMDENRIDFCKLAPHPNKKGKKIKDLRYAKFINKRQPYGINYLCGIYRKTYLMSLLDSTCKDSWEIEEMLLKQASESRRGYYTDKIIVTDNPLNIVFCVEKGKWSHLAKRLLIKKGYSISGNRETWSFWHDFFAGLKHFISCLLPIGLRYAIKRFFSKMGVKFATKQ